MKVSLQTLFDAHPALEILGLQFFSLDKIVPARNLFDQINAQYLVIAAKQEELLSFYGVKGEDEKYSVPDDKKAFYEKELSDFLDKDVDLDWQPVHIDDLGDIRLPLPAYELVKFLFSEEQAVS